MKKTVIVFALALFYISTLAQKQSGILYSEHELIDKTKEFWNAISHGEREKALSFFGDSIYLVINGNVNPKLPKEIVAQYFDSWLKLGPLKVIDAPSASPDVIDYKGGELWVMDWLTISGVENETGIKFKIPFHNLYLFTSEGKIATLYQYYDYKVFEEIGNSKKTIENGKVYINHPYINKVRKMVNAYCDMDIDSMLVFYDPEAIFTNSTMKWGEFENLDAIKKVLKKRFAAIEDIQMKQVGYPDCVYYEKSDGYTVYSWWIHSSKTKDTGKVVEFPIMISMNFNSEGKIAVQMDYYSTNHLSKDN